MTTKLTTGILRITGNLERPSTTKGTILANQGDTPGTFERVAPGADNEYLISDLTETSGVRWTSDTGNSGSSFTVRDDDTYDNPILYFLTEIDFTPNPTGYVMPACTITFMSIFTNSEFGWPTFPYSGGDLEFTFGYVPADTEMIAANFVDYSGGPHATIDYTDITSEWTSFTFDLSISVTAGQQLSVRLNNSLAPDRDISFSSLIIAKNNP